MKIHEYQGKDLLRRYGVPVPLGKAALSAADAIAAIPVVQKESGNPVVVVKAQIHAGGRGKGGGVKLARSVEEVRQHADRMLGMTLVTHQTGPAGKQVRRVLVEEGCDIARELYHGVVIDRATARLRSGCRSHCARDAMSARSLLFRSIRRTQASTWSAAARWSRLAPLQPRSAATRFSIPLSGYRTHGTKWSISHFEPSRSPQ